MFKKVKAKNAKEYISALPPERKDIIFYLHNFIQEQAPDLKPYFADNMLGYGKFKYVNSKGEEIDWPVIALANQKNYISLYVNALEEGQYMAELHKEELGKVSVGKSCIRFKGLDELNQGALAALIKRAAANPGLVINKE